ncbi:MAG TPA: hypothetical protein VF041_22135 [Gemmatimonadaceae bacterium]
MLTFRLPLAIAFGALACFLVLVATEPVGPGLDPDSVSYVSAARSLVHRGALEAPEDDWVEPDSTTVLAHFPPGFSAAIAVPLAFGMPPVQGARLVEALAALATMTIVVWLVSISAGLAAGAAAGAMLVCTPAIAMVHESVLSEPLFLALLAATLALMTRRADRPLLAGVGAALAALVRYAGISAIAAVGLWWLARGGGDGDGERADLRERVRGAALAILPGAIAMGAWVLRTVLETHERSAIRQLSLYGELAPTFREGAATIAAWLAPGLSGPWRAVAAGVVGVAMVALVVSAARRARGGSPARTLLAAAVVVGVCYAGVVLASRLLADPGIPLDERLLAPLVLLVEVAVAAALGAAWGAWRAPARAAAVALLVAWCAASAVVVVDDARYALETGDDYADVQWSGSRLIEWVRDHGRGRPLFTNYPTALYFHAGRLSRELPASPTPAEARAFADTVAARHGLIVAFERSSEFNALPDSLLSMIPAVAVARAPDGAIYEVRGRCRGDPARHGTDVPCPGAGRDAFTAR